MPLNSYWFVLVFLPITFVGYGLFQRYGSRRACIGWLLFTSVCFYAASGIAGLILITLSIGWDYVAARVFLSLPCDQTRSRKLIIYGAVATDIIFLCYFKYFSFILGVMSPTLASGLISSSPYLPLGLSFLTFQKIGFLTDLQSGQVRNVSLFDFALFGLFFPKAVAGPIVRYNEFTSQFNGSRQTLTYEDAAVGTCLLSIGLFKGTVMASIAAGFVSPAFSPRFPQDPIDFLTAWFGALGYTFQLYFEFSGYSDMALGAARLFGIKLPMNFNSPLKASSLVEFWSRWHITLTRFLTWQIYIPIARYLTRTRVKAGHSVLRGANSRISAVIVLVGVPTVFTLTISGIWHGSTWSYVLWGVIHGVCLSINQGWRTMRGRLLSNELTHKYLMLFVGRVLTMTTVIVAMVVFRAESVSSALAVLRGMAGLNGFIPKYLRILIGEGEHLNLVYILLDSYWYAFICLSLMLLIVTRAPNSLELLRPLRPALDFPPEIDEEERGGAKEALANNGPGTRRNYMEGVISLILKTSGDGMSLTFPAAFLYAAFMVLGLSAIERAGVFIYGQF